MQIEISNEGLIYLTDSVILSIIRCCCGLRNDIHFIDSDICEDIYLSPKDEINELLNKSKNYIKLKFYIQNFDHILPQNNFIENYFKIRDDKDGIGHWSRHSNNFYNKYSKRGIKTNY